MNGQIKEGEGKGEMNEDERESSPYLCDTGGLVLLCFFESMQGDTGPLGAGVTPLVEQRSYPEPHLPSLIPLSLYVL